QDFARAAYRGQDRRGAALVGQEKTHDVGFVRFRVQRLEGFLHAEDLDQRLPAGLHLFRQVQQQVAVDGDEARGRLRALQVASVPVEVVRDARQHQPSPSSASTIQVSLLPPPCELLTT